MQRKQIDLSQFVPQIYKYLFYWALQVTRLYKDFVLKGGRGSLKSTIAALIVVLNVYLGYGSAVCIRRYQKDVRKSCRATIIQTIKRLGLEKYFSWSLAPNGALQIKCLLNDKYIDFEGLDDPDKLKSYAEDGGIAAVWLEECQMIENISKIDNLQQTFDRGENNVIFIFCFNPKPIKNHWCNTELLVPADDKLILHTSYLDVPFHFLGEKFYARAEKLKARNYEQYLNEYMGEVVGTHGKVFRNIREISKDEILSIRSKATTIYRGLDLGFSTAGDPTAYTGWYFEEKNGELNLYCLFEEVHKGLKIRTLAELLQKENKWNSVIYSDVNPSVVDALVDDYDINVEAAYKHNLRDVGFYYLTTEIDNIYIAEALTPNTYREFTEYSFKETKDEGIDMSQYPKENDHCLDSCRYAMVDYIRAYSKVNEE